MIKKEEAEQAVSGLKPWLSVTGSSLEIVGVDDNDIKLKLTCAGGATQFKVAGKTVTMEDEVKKEIEKRIKAKLKSANVIFI